MQKTCKPGTGDSLLLIGRHKLEKEKLGNEILYRKESRDKSFSKRVSYLEQENSYERIKRLAFNGLESSWTRFLRWRMSNI